MYAETNTDTTKAEIMMLRHVSFSLRLYAVVFFYYLDIVYICIYRFRWLEVLVCFKKKKTNLVII